MQQMDLIGGEERKSDNCVEAVKRDNGGIETSIARKGGKVDITSTAIVHTHP